MLIVEDEALIRMNAIDVIEAAGFDIVDAVDADEAVEILEQRSDVAILFTDVRMPGSIDGLRLAACVRQRWPAIQVIVTSGHIGERPVAIPPDATFLPKPYNEGRLIAMLRGATA